ncbi:mannitol dehydrogenase family protein [Microbacterium aurum]
MRIVHLGLGAFARAHQAWYTASVDDDGEWGIAAFTGRSRAVADLLAPQNGLYSVIVRSADRDDVEVVTSIVEVAEGADVDRLVELLRAPETAIVTLTITEPGYRLLPDGSPDLGDPAVREDVEALRLLLADGGAEADRAGAEGAAPTTALGRLVLGLAARRDAGSGPIAVVPCDNMPDNGPFVRRGVVALARLADAAVAEWIDGHVSFVSTSVDRITPSTTETDLEVVQRETGWIDEAPVVTEPFHDWILSGDFPAGRPAWERAGARFVDDIEPFERRKLWLLNGAHSLLAYAGLRRGHETVAQAIADPELRRRVLELWDEASRHLDADQLDLDRYLPALLERFDNARIEHRLAQIAQEAVTKLRVRAVPVALAERAAGRSGGAAAVSIAEWIALVLAGADLPDARADEVTDAASAADPVVALLALLDEALAADAAFLSTVHGWLG